MENIKMNEFFELRSEHQKKIVSHALRLAGANHQDKELIIAGEKELVTEGPLKLIKWARDNAKEKLKYDHLNIKKNGFNRKINNEDQIENLLISALEIK